MTRRLIPLIAVLATVVLCVGSFDVASARAAKPDVKGAVAHATSTAPKALAVNIKSGIKKATLHLIAGTKLKAECVADHDVAQLDIVRKDHTQIDGTAYVTRNGDSIVKFFYNSGGDNAMPDLASSVYSTSAGGISVETGSNSYGTVNSHLLVTVPGAVFTIDSVIDVNATLGYCRISAEVESAAT